MRFFDRDLTKTEKQLIQINNRLVQHEALRSDKNKSRDVFKCIHKYWDRPVPQDFKDFHQFKVIENGRTRFSVFDLDNCCISLDQTLCVIRNVLARAEQKYLVVSSFGSITDFYNVGVGSMFNGIYKCSNLSDTFIYKGFSNRDITISYLYMNAPLNFFNELSMSKR